jgi:hypothetical protein
MVHFQTKNYNSEIFWRALKYKMFVYVFYGRWENLKAIWYTLCQFGNFVVIWYIFTRLGKL